jgi:hypothetical protein
MKYLKKFESTDWESENKFVSDLEDITLELKDEGMLVDIRLNRVGTHLSGIDGKSGVATGEYEIRINKPGKPGFINVVTAYTDRTSLIEWSEIKDTVIRLTEYCYDNGWSVRFWADGTEFMTGFKKEEDFTIGDGITQFSFRMLIKRL